MNYPRLIPIPMWTGNTSSQKIHPSIHPSMLHGVLVDRRSTWEESVSCPHTIHQFIHPAWYTGGGGDGTGRELILESGSFFEEF
jgi:hypothetical protein